MKFLTFSTMAKTLLGCCFVFSIALCKESGVPIISGKKLTSSVVPLLDAYFAKHPGVLLKMDVSLNKAENILEKSASAQHNVEEVKKQLLKLLEPVKDFFVMIKPFADTVKQLMEESLVTTKDVDAKEPILLGLLSTTKAPEVYFLEEIQTRSDLERFSREITVFFRDIQASLSSEIIKRHEELVAMIKAKKAHKK